MGGGAQPPWVPLSLSGLGTGRNLSGSETQDPGDIQPKQPSRMITLNKPNRKENQTPTRIRKDGKRLNWNLSDIWYKPQQITDEHTSDISRKDNNQRREEPRTVRWNADG